MVVKRSCWSRGAGRLRKAALAALVGGALLGGPRPAHAQDDLDDACTGALGGPVAECNVAAAAVRLIHPRVGLGLWGGSPVPGSASTLGMRLGSTPRFSVTARVVAVPMELPPLPDRSRDDGDGVLTAGVAAQGTVGLFSGWSPLPTVGGVLALDAIGRVAWLALPDGRGFDGDVIGWSGALRVGILRESFTLPGLSLTGAYGRSTRFAYGSATDDGRIEGAIGNWSATAAATKRVGPVGVTLGVSLDRYTSEVDFSYLGGPGERTADADTDSWTAFANASWTLLIFHASLEAGWQDSTVPEVLPAGVDLDPPGWWLGAAFRISI